MLVLFSLSDSGVNLADVYDRYADMLYRLALAHLGTREDAEDAVHDVFAKYISASPSFRDSEHEKAWFIRTTVNRCHDIFRYRSIRNHIALEEAEDISHTHEDEPEIIRIVHSLPEKYKSAIILHYLEGFSVEETAKILKITVSAVKMRLSRGRDYIKELIGKEES